MSERDWPSVALCIPTFRRPQGLRKLLAHVDELTYGGRLSVIVVDNDAGEEAGAHVVWSKISQDYPFPLTVGWSPVAASHAYNRAFRVACQPRRRTTTSPCSMTTSIPIVLAHGNGRRGARAHADSRRGPVLPVFDHPQHWLARSGLYDPCAVAAGRSR